MILYPNILESISLSSFQYQKGTPDNSSHTILRVWYSSSAFLVQRKVNALLNEACFKVDQYHDSSSRSLLLGKLSQPWGTWKKERTSEKIGAKLEWRAVRVKSTRWNEKNIDRFYFGQILAVTSNLISIACFISPQGKQSINIAPSIIYQK